MSQWIKNPAVEVYRDNAVLSTSHHRRSSLQIENVQNGKDQNVCVIAKSRDTVQTIITTPGSVSPKPLSTPTSAKFLLMHNTDTSDDDR